MSNPASGPSQGAPGPRRLTIFYRRRRRRASARRRRFPTLSQPTPPSYFEFRSPGYRERPTCHGVHRWRVQEHSDRQFNESRGYVNCIWLAFTSGPRLRREKRRNPTPAPQTAVMNPTQVRPILAPPSQAAVCAMRSECEVRRGKPARNPSPSSSPVRPHGRVT